MIKLIQKIDNQQFEHIVLPFYEKNVQSEEIYRFYKRDVEINFEGTAKEILFLPKLAGQTTQIILLGLGDTLKQEKISGIFRFLFHKMYKNLRGKSLIWTEHLKINKNEVISEIALGVSLADYSCGLHKENSHERKSVFSEIEVTIQSNVEGSNELILLGEKTASALKNCMNLVDQPSNVKTPEYLASYVQQSAKSNGFKSSVITHELLADNGLHAIAAVGRGSVNKPCLIEMEYKPPTDVSLKKIAFVGKGITFDTGGISIKGSNNLHLMKCDMGGAAAVVGAIELISQLRLPIHAIGVVPAAENMVDGNSFRPGDVIYSHAGKSIEIIDTDAEGRLVLADGLSYAIKKYNPDFVIDIATLTGSAVATLGSAAAAFMCKDEVLAQQIYAVGQSSGDRVWRLPLWDEYFEMMQSDIADIKNLSSRPVAGAVTAAKFLEFFTHEHSKWAHIDIAGVCFVESEFSKSRSANGFGVRLLTEIAKHLSKIVE